MLFRSYSKWIVIFQEFDLEFIKFKSNKYLVLAEILCDLLSDSNTTTSEPSIPNESLFMIESSDPWCCGGKSPLQTEAIPTSPDRV